MRDPARIDRMVELLRWYWHMNPDLRLGQIIVNLTPKRFTDHVVVNPGTPSSYDTMRVDPFYVEDDEWEQVLDRALGTL